MVDLRRVSESCDRWLLRQSDHRLDGSCDKAPFSGKRVRDRSWQAQVGSQHIGRIRGYPCAEVVGTIVPVVEPGQQAQDAATGVADVVSGAHRHVTDVTCLELLGHCVTHSQINTHLSRTLKIVLPLVGVQYDNIDHGKSSSALRALVANPMT